MNRLEQQLLELLNEWDPIGIVEDNEMTWHDEYASYVKSIIKLIKHGADDYKMTNHLEHTATVNIGVSRSPSNTVLIAKKLVSL